MTVGLKDSDNKTESKVGVYVCHCGGNISNTVDVEKVVEASLKMPGVALAQHNMFVCSDPGQDLIKDDILRLRCDVALDPSSLGELFRLPFYSRRYAKVVE